MISCLISVRASGSGKPLSAKTTSGPVRSSRANAGLSAASLRTSKAADLFIVAFSYGALSRLHCKLSPGRRRQKLQVEGQGPVPFLPKHFLRDLAVQRSLISSSFPYPLNLLQKIYP